MTAHPATLTLSDFLLARLEEDEAVAREAEPVDDRRGVEEGTEAWTCRSQGWHVGMSPARVLAECEAKRRIVAHAAQTSALSGATDYTQGSHQAAQFALRALASIHSDHPDYREEWRA